VTGGREPRGTKKTRGGGIQRPLTKRGRFAITQLSRGRGADRAKREANFEMTSYPRKGGMSRRDDPRSAGDKDAKRENSRLTGVT